MKHHYEKPAIHPLADRPIVAHDATIITSYDLLGLFQLTRKVGFQGLAAALADLANYHFEQIKGLPPEAVLVEAGGMPPRHAYYTDLCIELSQAMSAAHQSAFVQINPEGPPGTSRVLRRGEGSAIEDIEPEPG